MRIILALLALALCLPAQTFIQSTTCAGQSGPTLTCTFSSPVGNRHVVVVTAINEGNFQAPASVADAAGSVYTTILNPSCIVNASGQTWYSNVATGGFTTLTISYVGATMSAAALEYDGPYPATNDGTAGFCTPNMSITVNTSFSRSGNLTVLTAGNAFSSFGWNSITPTTGWTQRAYIANSGSTAGDITVWDQHALSSGAYSQSGTGSSGTVFMILASLRLSVSGGGGVSIF